MARATFATAWIRAWNVKRNAKDVDMTNHMKHVQLLASNVTYVEKQTTSGRVAEQDQKIVQSRGNFRNLLSKMTHLTLMLTLMFKEQGSN